MDRIQVKIVPLLLGDGIRLFGRPAAPIEPATRRSRRATASPAFTTACRPGTPSRTEVRPRNAGRLSRDRRRQAAGRRACDRTAVARSSPGLGQYGQCGVDVAFAVVEVGRDPELVVSQRGVDAGAGEGGEDSLVALRVLVREQHKG